MRIVRPTAPRAARLRAAALLAPLALSAAVAACDDSPADPPAVAGTFVGRVAGTTALVTLVTNGTDVRAYACDGTPDGQLTISEWFKGTSSADAVDLPSVSGSARIVADVRAGTVTGRIEIPGRPALAFTASPAEGAAGFYLYKNDHGGAPYWAGWVVLNDGAQRGSQAQPTRTSLSVSLNTATATAQLPGVGAVRPARLTPANVIAGFGGGQCTGLCCPCAAGS